MKLVRKLHLYLGCFFSPLLLLFIGTGWRQTMSPHKKLTNSLPDKLSSIHLNQTFPAETGGAYSPQLFQYLVVGMCVALIFTILLGIFLAFKTSKRKWPVYLSLILGIVVPILLLWLGQPAASRQP